MDQIQSQIDFRNRFYPVWNQQGLLLCTACSIADALAWELRSRGRGAEMRGFVPSPLFVYFNTRKKTGQYHMNVPVEMSDCMDAVSDYGVCHENHWPIVKSRYCEPPPPDAYRAAEKYAGARFEPLEQTHRTLTKSLSEDHPFFFCFRLYHCNSWDFHKGKIAQTGRMETAEERYPHTSNHAALAVGYNDSEKVFILRNSFGNEWGLKGYFTIAYDYVLDGLRAYNFWRVDHPIIQSQQ